MLPILIQIGPITIYSFGFLIGIGFLIATFLIFRETKKEYFDEEKVFDVVFTTTIGGLIGARAFYIIEHFDRFGFNFLNYILVNARPGFSLWGGIGVGIAVFLLMCSKRKLPVYKLLDMVTVGILVSFIFAYVGAFLSGMIVGTPTNLPWGVIFFSTLKRHPVSLYEALGSLMVLAVILKLKPLFVKKRIPAGNLFFSFVSLQGLILFPIAFFKEDVIVIEWIWTIDNLIYLSIMLIGSIFFYKRLGRNIKNDLIESGKKIGKLFKSKKGENEKVSA